MDSETRRYLVLLQLGNASPDRLKTVVPGLKSVLERLSTEPIEQAFRSATADIFGYFIRSKRNATQISATIESPAKDPWFMKEGEPMIGPFLDSGDAILVIEGGSDFCAGRGFTRVGTWLQHH